MVLGCAWVTAYGLRHFGDLFWSTTLGAVEGGGGLRSLEILCS